MKDNEELARASGPCCAIYPITTNHQFDAHIRPRPVTIARSEDAPSCIPTPATLLLHTAPSLTRIDRGARLMRFTTFFAAHSAGDSEAGSEERLE